MVSKKRKHISILSTDFLSVFFNIEDKIIWKCFSLTIRIAKPKRWKAFRLSLIHI